MLITILLIYWSTYLLPASTPPLLSVDSEPSKRKILELDRPEFKSRLIFLLAL